MSAGMGLVCRKGALASLVAIVALGGATASAQAPEAAATGAAEAADRPGAEGAAAQDAREETTTSLRLQGLKGGRLTVGKRVTAKGTMRPFGPGERVSVILSRGKKTIKRKTFFVRQRKAGSKIGQFELSHKLIRPGRYRVQAIKHPSARQAGSKDRTRSFRMRYPRVRAGNRSRVVKVFNRLLAKQGYVNGGGRSYNSATQRAVMAFRKVNRMARTTKATTGIFKKLARGRGGYRLRYPKAGKHVEADLSRQVMVLAKGRKVRAIFHVSSGKSSTPTRTGSWRFYRKEPGVNNVGMHWSVYYDGGYATHGYPSVPTYPASAGCLRNPIPNSRFIYNWIDIGDPIFVYR
jgi:hypothetical protein